jgi:hypothetical protein
MGQRFEERRPPLEPVPVSVSHRASFSSLLAN